MTDINTSKVAECNQVHVAAYLVTASPAEVTEGATAVVRVIARQLYHFREPPTTEVTRDRVMLVVIIGRIVGVSVYNPTE